MTATKNVAVSPSANAAISPAELFTYLPNFDPTIDPQVGEWVMVSPSRMAALLDPLIHMWERQPPASENGSNTFTTAAHLPDTADHLSRTQTADVFLARDSFCNAMSVPSSLRGTAARQTSVPLSMCTVKGDHANTEETNCQLTSPTGSAPSGFATPAVDITESPTVAVSTPTTPPQRSSLTEFIEDEESIVLAPLSLSRSTLLGRKRGRLAECDAPTAANATGRCRRCSPVADGVCHVNKGDAEEAEGAPALPILADADSDQEELSAHRPFYLHVRLGLLTLTPPSAFGGSDMIQVVALKRTPWGCQHLLQLDSSGAPTVSGALELGVEVVTVLFPTEAARVVVGGSSPPEADLRSPQYLSHSLPPRQRALASGTTGAVGENEEDGFPLNICHSVGVNKLWDASRRAHDGVSTRECGEPDTHAHQDSWAYSRPSVSSPTPENQHHRTCAGNQEAEDGYMDAPMDSVIFF